MERNREILTETVRMLDEEEREDSELRSRFKDKWTRQPSPALAENLRKEVWSPPPSPYPHPLILSLSFPLCFFSHFHSSSLSLSLPLSLPPSLPLSHPLQVTKFQTILETASNADQTVRQKFESHKEAIVLLGKPVAELQAALPKAGALSPHVQGSQVSCV